MEDPDNEPDTKVERAIEGGFEAAREIAVYLRDPDGIRQLNSRMDHLLRLHMSISNIIYAVAAETRQ